MVLCNANSKYIKINVYINSSEHIFTTYMYVCMYSVEEAGAYHRDYNALGFNLVVRTWW